ncbi:DNA binding protein [Streptomyces phage Olicious]|uniref:DNA binding protein n=5 Tax=Immanueltrevirus immanuel3 TaxID=2846399 RepID=A0A2H5BM59_9CAUD|nr:DNA binding protein [Streptomyces phage HaugeAnator]AUG87437.1 DNA binding protein [Streptomyces phage Percastrophe]AUG87502.1 DNA binding protein [Streptomyces phage Romero]AUG87631.1 DNA binding protein [Streptomyces phage ZooBear]AZF95857.1 DNA binding protein [Streptomyces phage Olicious]
MALDPNVFRPMVKQVARSVSSAYPPYVTSEDTEGHLWVWIYDKRSTLLATVEDDPQNWEAKIASTLRKVASSYCAKEKASVEGYSLDDLYRYTIPKIKSLMADVFSYVDWQSFGQHGDGQPTARAQANTTGDRVAELADVKVAVGRLPNETKELLYLVHAMNYTADNLADHFEISEEAAKKRMQRVYGSVQKELGRKDPSEQPRAAERRTVRSNASWRASQAGQYEG